ncbi:hypothetical protein B0H10DRAFT_2427091 [Mycena sp. CBHHK59/15]|nr:hypothetical protein B0H10DRAFT_2427091 [Mycena sp. CBHHK59/15]
MGQIQRLHYDEHEITNFPLYWASSIAAAYQEWFSARAINEKRSARLPVKALHTFSELKQSKQCKLRAEARPRVMENLNARSIQEWSTQCTEAKTRMKLNNTVFVRDVISPKERLPYRALLQTPTLARALTRSLTPSDLQLCHAIQRSKGTQRAMRHFTLYTFGSASGISATPSRMTQNFYLHICTTPTHTIRTDHRLM